MRPTPRRRADGMATSADGTRIAWYRYGSAERTVLFVPTWNIVDARVVGHQVAALEPHATVITYDPRGAGRSGRPERGYDFPLHAADALAVLEANGREHAALVTASRGVNAALLLVADDPERFDRVAVVAPYMQLDGEAPDPDWLEELRTDWPGFIVPFMHELFTEPGSADLIAEMIAIGLEATPAVVVTQELDWERPARLLSVVACPNARHPREGRRSSSGLARGAHSRRDAERAAGAHRGRRAPARHPHPGARQPAPVGVPARPVERGDGPRAARLPGGNPPRDSLLSPSVTRRVIDRMAQQPTAETPYDERLGELTPREREVLAQVARGLSNTEIADALFIEGSTVKTHVKRIHMKLQLRDRVQVIFAYESGLTRAGSA